MDLDLPGGPAGNPPIKKKRRSSILKMPTAMPLNGGAGSERGALQDLNLNSPQRIPPHAHTPTFHRRQSKRVSFSSCKMVKEFETGSQTLTVWNNTYEEDHSHATSSSSHGTDSSSYSQDHSEIGILPAKKARHREESPLDLDQSVFPSPPTRDAQFDRTVNATSAMELTRAMTPSPRGADLSAGSQVMEMTLAPCDESGLSALATSHYTNGFLQGLDTTTGEPEMEDVTRGMEMTKSVSRAYLLKMEERPSVVPPTRTDVSSALHYLQELDATSNPRSQREFRGRGCSGNVDQTTRSDTEELEIANGDRSTQKKAFDPNLSMELTNKVPVAHLEHGEESRKEGTRSISAQISLTANTKEGHSSGVPIQQSGAEDPNDSMEMTRATGACIQSAINLAQNVGHEGFRSGLLDKGEGSEAVNESMELTKAIGVDPKNTKDQEDNMEFTQSVNPSIMSGQKNTVVLDDSMDLTKAIAVKTLNSDNPMSMMRRDASMDLTKTKAIKDSCPPNNKSQDESMEFTRAIKDVCPPNNKSHDDSMEFTRAIKTSIRTDMNGQDDSVELTKAIKASIPAETTSQDDSMEFTRAATTSMATDLNGQDDSMELTKAVKASIAADSKSQDNSMEFTRAIKASIPADTNGQDDSMELTKAIKTSIPADMNGQDDSMELTKAIKASVPAETKRQDDSMELTKAIKASVPAETKRQDDSMELTKAIKTSIPADMNGQDDSMELTKAIKASIPAESKSQHDSMECTRAITTSIASDSKSQDNSMEFTRAVQDTYSAETKSKDISLEFTRASKACHAMKDQDDTMELTKSVSNHSQSKLFNYESKSMEQTYTLRHYTNDNVNEENHTQRFSMEITTSKHTEQMRLMDIKPQEVSNKRSIAETFQVSPEKIPRDERSNPNNIQQAPEDVGTALEKMLEQESRTGLSQEDTMELTTSSSAAFHPNKSTNQESGPTEEPSSKHTEELVSYEASSIIIQSSSHCENNLVQEERALQQVAPTNVPEPQVKKTTPPVKPQRQKISIFAWLARLQRQTLTGNTPLDHGRWELNNMTDWRATLSFLHNTLVLNISLGYSLPVDESWDSSHSIKHWTISSIEFQNPTLTEMCSNGDPAIKLIHRLILRQLTPSKLLKMCPSTLHLNEALMSIGDIIRHGARFVLTLEDLASSHFYFAIRGLKITLGFLRKNLSFMVSVNFSHLENLGQAVEISNAKGPVDQMTLKYLAVSVFKRENIDEWKFLPEFVSEVEQYLDVSSKS